MCVGGGGGRGLSGSFTERCFQGLPATALHLPARLRPSFLAWGVGHRIFGVQNCQTSGWCVVEVRSCLQQCEMVDIECGNIRCIGQFACCVCRANSTGGKPVAGSNVTIPFGWQLVIDESPPHLNLVLI